MNTSKNISPRYWIKRSVHYVYRALIEPRLANDDDKRHELILNTILLFSISLIFLLELSVIYNTIDFGPAYHGGVRTALVGAVLLLIFFGFLALSRNGYIKFPAYGIIILYFFAVTYSELEWGMGLPAGLLGYAFIILMSSFLVGSRFGFKLSLLIVVVILGLAYDESSRHLLPYWKTLPTVFSSGIQYSIMLLVITGLAWLATSEIEKSLQRAKHSENELRLERDQLEIRVEKRSAELRKAQAEKVSQLYRFAEFGKLSSGIFHDLITPLSGIALNIDNIHNSFHPDLPLMKEHLSRAVSASKRMDSFMSAIRKQVSLNDFKEVFSVNDSIEESLLLFSYRAIKSHIMLTFNATEHIKLYGNPIHFQQIVTNLISNALYATEQKDIPNEEKIVSIDLEKKESHIILKVSDNGNGIPEAIIKKIFEPFFTSKQAHQGMGLGLSTTKEIVEKQYGGHIQVETIEGKCTTFIITIPLTYEEHSNKSNDRQSDQSMSPVHSL